MTAPSAVEVLLVEDNPDDAQLTLLALAEAHLANGVKHIEDGEQALDFLRGSGAFAGESTNRPKVMLLDLKLPKVDGLEVLREVRADPGLRSLPVVILTSSKEEVDLVRGYELGANSYITKPVDWEQFISAVRDLGMYWLLVNQPPPAPT